MGVSHSTHMMNEVSGCYVASPLLVELAIFYVYLSFGVWRARWSLQVQYM